MKNDVQLAQEIKKKIMEEIEKINKEKEEFEKEKIKYNE